MHRTLVIRPNTDRDLALRKRPKRRKEKKGKERKKKKNPDS